MQTRPVEKPAFETRVHAVLDDLLDLVDWPQAPRHGLEITPAPRILPTPWPIGVMATAVLAALGLAVAEITARRSGKRPQITIASQAAELAMASSNYLYLNEKSAKFSDPLTGFHLAGDGGWIYLHGNFPHLRKGLLSMLGVGDEAAGLDDALARRSAAGIETEAITRGLCAARLRHRKEWLTDAHATKPPLLRFQELAAAPRRQWHAGNAAGGALDGLRVLDLTRVIAGPMGGRALAEHGADVMRIAGPGLPAITSLVIDTGFGKMSAMLDLGSDGGRRDLDRLIGQGDVLIDGYRPGALAARGFGPEQMARAAPGLVSVGLSAFAAGTDWAARRGYDSMLQTTTGMAHMPAGAARPTLLPCQPIDYLSGYLIAFGVMMALLRQADHGGSWHLDLSLAATAEWMWRMRDLVGDEDDFPDTSPDPRLVKAASRHYQTEFGAVRALAPALLLDGRPMGWRRMPVPLGADPPFWPAPCGGPGGG